MFDFLKKKIKGTIEKIAAVQQPTGAGQEPAKAGIAERIKKRVTEVTLQPHDTEPLLEELKTDLLASDVALDVADVICENINKELAGKNVPRGSVESEVRGAFRKALLDIVRQSDIDMMEIIKKPKSGQRPALLLFLGTNGAGKTTTIAKVADMLLKNGVRPVIAAGDTFRAASIEQLEVHGGRLGVKVIRHTYGADAAAVVFDARDYARAHDRDVILADTAGRSHSNTDLMDELKKVCRVNKPDLKILVLDSLIGNDAVEQAHDFDTAVGVDGIILTKMDVNKKGGAALSVAHTIGKPVLFIGTGQDYDDIRKFDAEKFVDELLGFRRIRYQRVVKIF